ncbi:hypothetical protein UP10_11440 [Bradyrhizobium sp. LTSPM299]|nr:hypothetical protein UP10_11440 [Bradyrhizobium sp. LTSPM299]
MSAIPGAAATGVRALTAPMVTPDRAITDGISVRISSAPIIRGRATTVDMVMVDITAADTAAKA